VCCAEFAGQLACQDLVGSWPQFIRDSTISSPRYRQLAARQMAFRITDYLPHVHMVVLIEIALFDVQQLDDPPTTRLSG
jgi:hypothetical protein